MYTYSLYRSKYKNTETDKRDDNIVVLDMYIINKAIL